MEIHSISKGELSNWLQITFWLTFICNRGWKQIRNIIHILSADSGISAVVFDIQRAAAIYLMDRTKGSSIGINQNISYKNSHLGSISRHRLQYSLTSAGDLYE
jgi:hypothetical protein